MTIPLTETELAPAKITRYAQLDDIAYELFGTALERGPAAQRVLGVAKQKYVTRGEQMNAITLALQEEMAATPKVTPALKNLNAAREEVRTRMWTEQGAPIRDLEDGRPRWSIRSHDVIGNDSQGHCSPHDMQWRSASIGVPISEHYGNFDSDGRFHSAAIMLDLRQTVTSNRTLVALERHCYNDKDQPVIGAARHLLTVPEAAELARTLLLLVDVAIETTEGA
jgi:hypothetical protein